MLLCWMMVLFLPLLEAQIGTDFNRINQETYRLYTESNWDSLVLTGKEALRQKVDYYYLRMRIGIAYFNKKNYRTAALHFIRAMEMNQGDPVALEYLYFSRLYAGQTQQAGAMRARFEGGLADKLPKERGDFFNKAGAEYLYEAASHDHPLNDPEALLGLPAGSQPVTLHFSNFNLSLENRITPGISLAHSYTYLSKYNHFYLSDGLGTYYDLDEQHQFQHQYYLSPRFTTPSGFTFMPMVHLITVSYQTIISTTGGGMGGGYMGGSGSTLGYVTGLDLAGGLKVVKAWGPVDITLGGSYAGLNRAHQLQGRIGLTWYPLGNLNLYAGAALDGQREWAGEQNVFRWIPDITLGVAIAEKVWIEAEAALGEMHNYLASNGAIVYNGYSEVIDRKVRLTLMVPVTQKGSMLYLGGRWSTNQSSYIPDAVPLPGSENIISYQTLSIYGGITWKF
jgi:hypothetical protein